MHLPVDLLVPVEIGPAIGETRLHLRVAHLRKRFRPQHLWLALRGQGGNGATVRLAKVAVDGQEALEQSFR